MKRQMLTAAAVLLLLFTATQQAYAQKWQKLGNNFGAIPPFRQTTPQLNDPYYAPALTYSSKDNTYYTAFIDGNRELVVMKLNVSTGIPTKLNWVKVGATTATNLDFTAPSIVINPLTHEPYVAFVDQSINEYTVLRFDAKTQSWTPVGAGIGKVRSGDYLPVLNFIPNTDSLFIAFISDEISRTVTVKEFDGKKWNPVGQNTIGNASNAAPPYCSIAIHPVTHEPYLAYVDANNHLTVRYLDNNTWSDFGIIPSASPVTGISSNALAFSTLTKKLFLAYSVGAYKCSRIIKANIGKKNPATGFSPVVWADVKSDSLSCGSTVFNAIAFAPNASYPYITGYNAAGGVFLVRRFTGKTWVNLGFTDCVGLSSEERSVGPSCGYNNSRQTPGLFFNPVTKKACLTYANELDKKYEIRYEP